MLAIIISSFTLLLLFISFGFLFQKITQIDLSFADLILMGLVITNSLTAWLSLFLPINSSLLILLVVACAFILFRNKIYPGVILHFIKKNTVLSVIIAGFFLIALIVSAGPPLNYDTGLYHLQMIKWIEKYPVVPGLGNLHGRLGFNSNILLVNALSSFEPVFGQEIFSLNLLLFAILTCYLISSSFQVYKSTGISNILLFNLIALIFLIRLENLSSPSPDYIATVVPLYIFIRVFNFPEDNEGFDFKPVIPLALIAVYMVTVKLSTLPILLLFLLLLWKYRRAILPFLPKMALACSVIILPWLIRNVILTGWLLYPFPHLNLFGFDWKIPIAKVIFEKESVTGWARIRGIDPHVSAGMTYQWIPKWWRYQSSTDRRFLFCSFLLPVLGIIALIFKFVHLRFFKKSVLITAYAGLLFWFIMAPDIRFGESFVLVCGFSFLIYVPFSFESTGSNLKYILVLVVLLFYDAFFNRVALRTVARDQMEPFHSLLVPEKIAIPANVRFVNRAIKGGMVLSPIYSDQCFDQNIPCTPFYDSTLMQRGITLDHGFKPFPR